MKKPYVSIIIPVYNSEKYLKKCLDSVVNQTLKNIEIICVNDGSTDESPNILAEYSKEYKNIKLINQDNQGVNGARISGYNNATGEYIAWVDSDDFIENDMFEKMYDMAKKKNSDIVICNYNFYPKKVTNKEKWYKEYNGVNNWRFISRNTIQWNKIVRKKLLDRLNIISLFKSVGEGCYSIVLISTNKITTIDENLYNYRVGHSSLSSNYKNVEWYKKTVQRAINKYNYIVDNNYSNEWKEYFKYVYLYYYLLLLIISAYNNDKSTFNECKIQIKNEKLFSKKYREYLQNHFTVIKIIFFKYFGVKNYNIMKLVSKMILK